MFISSSIQDYEYSKRKILLPWKRKLDTPYVYMKEKHKMKSKNWISVEPNNRKGDLQSTTNSSNSQEEGNISTWRQRKVIKEK